jgi:kinesin family protein 22
LILISCELSIHTFVASLSQVYSLNSAACKGRSVAATNFNRASSRSHAILGIKVSVTERYPGAPSTFPATSYSYCTDIFLPTELVGKINLVDLAGSENNKVRRDFYV